MISRPEAISGDNGLAFPGCWGREPASEIPTTPAPQRSSGNHYNSRNSQISPDCQGFRDFGSCALERVASAAMSGAGGRIWGVLISSLTGPVLEASSSGIPVFWGRGPAPQIPCALPYDV